MNKQEINRLFSDYISTYDEDSKKEIWKYQSEIFREFWKNKIMNNNVHEISDAEVDQIISILDRNAKGNTKESEAVARVMIAQGAWRRMFRDIKENHKLHNQLNSIFAEDNDDKRMKLLDELYEINQGRKNSLTGKSANAINAMLFVFRPTMYVSVVSLNDRKKVIEYFSFNDSPDFEKDTMGKKIVLSNKCIINGFRSLNIKYTPHTISRFLYETEIKGFWKMDSEDDPLPWGGAIPSDGGTMQTSSDVALFYMESQLEDFLIENWDKTELGKKYDLIEEDGVIISQQYKTDIGRIDILAEDKKSKQYVVIELKKNQTSDDTVGQITRYMGWLDEHKTNGKLAKGIIIAAQYDTRLYYALKRVKEVEVYLYRVDFKLKEFTRTE